MQCTSLFALAAVGVAFLAADAMETLAQEPIPLNFGTYARSKDWCRTSRADQNGPDYKERRAFINLSATEINWNDTVGKIKGVSIERSRINLNVELNTSGKVENKTLQLTRKNRKTFVFVGINFFYCADYQPNPRLGR